MNIAITYDEGRGITTTEFKNVRHPTLTQWGFYQVHDLDGRLMTQIPLSRVVRIDYTDNALTTAEMN